MIDNKHKKPKYTAGFTTLCKDKNCDRKCGNLHYVGVPIIKDEVTKGKK